MTDPAPQTAAERRRAREARRAVAVLVVGMTLIGVALGLFAWRLQPPEGDLARISGASSRDFGWRGEAEGFARDHRRELSPQALLRGADPGEVLVFGDSFSIRHAGGISWINTLHEATGLEVVFVRIHGFGPVLNYLGSETFARRPPRAVIVQSVERVLLERAVALHDPVAACEPPTAPFPIAAATEAPLALSRVRFPRRTKFKSFDELMSWGALATRLRLSSNEPVLEVALGRPDMFSHRASDRALILGADVTNHLLPRMRPAKPDQAAETLVCGLRRLATAARGRVPLWVMIAPDKRTAYDPWITDPLPPKTLDLYLLARAALGNALIDPLPALRAVIEGGTRDVHFPDDSHWGPAGHRIVGELAARALTGED